MKVPFCFKKEVFRIAKKRNYSSATKFLEKEGTSILQNADYVTDGLDNLRSMFGFKKHEKRKR